jgi:hypothetical protein
MGSPAKNGLTPAHICAKNGLTPAHICAKNGLTPAHICAQDSALVKGLPLSRVPA